jgi:hypothetical protein
MEYKHDYFIILAFVWAVTFPLLTWLTFRLIEKVYQARARIEELKALWYRVDQLNTKMVEKARAKGIQIVPGPIRPPYEEIFERGK